MCRRVQYDSIVGLGGVEGCSAGLFLPLPLTVVRRKPRPCMWLSLPHERSTDLSGVYFASGLPDPLTIRHGVVQRMPPKVRRRVGPKYVGACLRYALLKSPNDLVDSPR
jgi:hypothetical protein